MQHHGDGVKNQGRLDEALGWLRKAVAIDPSRPKSHGSLLCCMNYSWIDLAELLAEHRRAGSLYERGGAFPQYPALDPARPLRIGYVSPDFCRHPVAAFMQAVLQCHDQERFRTFVYSDRAIGDQITERLRGTVPCWRDAFGWTDAELAARIRADEIDILVELSGHTAHNRLAALVLRPAGPGQLPWLPLDNRAGIDRPSP